MTKDTGIVNIHGKEYKTVAKRVSEFREAHKQDLAIITSVVSIDKEAVVMKAEIATKDGFVIATGFAEEKRSASSINKTSALENCETSAIGRALANFGLAGGEYASADEVAQAISQQNDKPKRNYGGISFEEIQLTLDSIDDAESIKAYAKELKQKIPNSTEKQAYHIRTMVARRLQEVDDADSN